MPLVVLRLKTPRRRAIFRMHSMKDFLFLCFKTCFKNHNCLILHTDNKNTVTNLHLEDIDIKFKACLTANFTGFLLECCVVCLDSQKHQSGVVLKAEKHTKNKIQNSFALNWQLVLNPIIRNTHTDVNRTTDFGAMCLALLLTNDIWANEGVWISSQQGEGVDFWLLNPNTLKPIARLEISGIRKETARNTIGTRIKKKIAQTHQSDDSGAIAYISVIEFSKPSAIFIQK